MKLYVASTWKLKDLCLSLAKLLRDHGHEVDCFCDPSTGRYSLLVEKEEDLEENDQFAFMADPRSQRAFQEDKKWLDWAEGVVLIIPPQGGRSSHLEAGYIKGRGKLLFALGKFPPGEFEVMYGFADGTYRITDEADMTRFLGDLDGLKCDRCGALARSKFGPDGTNIQLCGPCWVDWIYFAERRPLECNESRESFLKVYNEFLVTERGHS
jgi:hypothetical protein